MHRLQISALPLAVTNCQISSIFQLFSLSTHCYGSLQSFSTSLLAFWVDCPGGNRGRGKAVACRQVSRCRLCRFQEEKDRKTDGAGPSHQVSCGIKQTVRRSPFVNKISTSIAPRLSILVPLLVVSNHEMFVAYLFFSKKFLYILYI